MYRDFDHLISSNSLNGVIDLDEISLTRDQLCELKKYISTHHQHSLLIIRIREEGMVLIDDKKDSDLL